mmetsp:Transcript_29811/g.103038  ORF Transcript_29811/g.103038 Transcript_29811/m.103038 type:complete len:206 (+) Transcript_29811:408-1025(+)
MSSMAERVSSRASARASVIDSKFGWRTKRPPSDSVGWSLSRSASSSGMDETTASSAFSLRRFSSDVASLRNAKTLAMLSAPADPLGRRGPRSVKSGVVPSGVVSKNTGASAKPRRSGAAAAAGRPANAAAGAGGGAKGGADVGRRRAGSRRGPRRGRPGGGARGRAAARRRRRREQGVEEAAPADPKQDVGPTPPRTEKGLRRPP